MAMAEVVIDRTRRMRCRKTSGLIRALGKFTVRAKRWGDMASFFEGLRHSAMPVCFTHSSPWPSICKLAAQ